MGAVTGASRAGRCALLHDAAAVHRTGPGAAKDGKPKFDLSVFDQTYFDRLRERVLAAGRAGIYASVMLFEGFSLHLTATPDNIEGHPFHAANNVNDIAISSIISTRCCRSILVWRHCSRPTSGRWIDTVHHLPNVLYEVANESSGNGRFGGDPRPVFDRNADRWCSRNGSTG